MEISIAPVEHKDMLSIYRLLKDSKALVTNSLIEDILEHIEKNVAIKLVVDSELAGVWMSKEEDEYVGLSFFFIREDMRCTTWSVKLFRTGVGCVSQDKPLMIAAKDTTGFDKYVTKIDDNLYAFKGFR